MFFRSFMNLELEIKNQVLLCARNGKLNPTAVGWSRHPLHRCNLTGRFLRKKRWNYWCIYDRDFLVSFTISDVDYSGVCFVYYLDFRTMQFEEMTVLAPFGMGVKLGQLTDNDASFQNSKMKLEFVTEETGRRIRASIPNMNGKKVEADIFIPASQQESLNVVIPWSKSKFQYTSKQFCLAAQGQVTIDSKLHEFKKDDAFAVLDFGRGVWPYNTIWNWASVSSRSKGNVFGLNMGAGWTDGTGYTENAISVNGKVYKLSEDILFKYDRNDYMKPWEIKSSTSQAVDLVFTPLYERKAVSNLLIVTSDVHQMIGKYSGKIKIGRHSEYELDGDIGWAEDHKARW